MSSSYMRRNQQTSQGWYSHSLPSTSYLTNHMRYQGSISASPSPTSPPSKYAAGARPYSARVPDSNSRPDSGKYSYGGGIFIPKKPKQDYFVIHPDWVSESMTVQKLSLKPKERQPSMTTSRAGTWPGRRCKSAPPPKLRNPITWDMGQVEREVQSWFMNLRGSYNQNVIATQTFLYLCLHVKLHIYIYIYVALNNRDSYSNIY